MLDPGYEFTMSVGQRALLWSLFAPLCRRSGYSCGRAAASPAMILYVGHLPHFGISFLPSPYFFKDSVILHHMFCPWPLPTLASS